MIQFDLPKQKSSIIKVLGVGGGGSNAVNFMFKQDIEGVDFIICNTDSKAIEQSDVPNKIQLGPHLTQGLGAGADPSVGKLATEESLDEIRKILEVNTRMAFITVGMGGGTGTGGAPIIAKICKDLGILTVGIVTTPFGFEGPRRQKQAEEGIKQLKPLVDTLLVISNDKLRVQYGNLKMKEAFTKADNVLATAAKCITDVINSRGHIIVDFADVCTVMKNGGVAILGKAEVEGEHRAQRAIEEALNSPLLNDNDIRGAKWILLNINSAEGDHECTMDELETISEFLRERTGENADVIIGMGYEASLDKKLGITLIATGFEHKDPFKMETPKKAEAPIEEKIVMTLVTDAPLSEQTKEEPLEKTLNDITPDHFILDQQEVEPIQYSFNQHQIKDENKEASVDAIIETSLQENMGMDEMENEVSLEMQEEESIEKGEEISLEMEEEVALEMGNVDSLEMENAVSLEMVASTEMTAELVNASEISLLNELEVEEEVLLLDEVSDEQNHEIVLEKYDAIWDISQDANTENSIVPTFILNKPANIYADDDTEVINLNLDPVLELEEANDVTVDEALELDEEEAFELTEVESFEAKVEATIEEEFEETVEEELEETVEEELEETLMELPVEIVEVVQTPLEIISVPQVESIEKAEVEFESSFRYESEPAMQLVMREETNTPVARATQQSHYDMPLDNAEEQRRKVAERIQKLRNLSFNINNGNDANNEFEAVPAYVRRNLDMFGNTMASVENYYSKYTVDKDENNQTQISTINTFLDGKKPD